MAARPLTVTAAAALQAAEGAAALGFGLFVAWEALVGTPMDDATAWGVAGMAVLGAVFMAAVGRGLLRGERWSRSPAVVTQLFALPISLSLLQSDQYAYGVPLAIVAVLILGLVLCGPSTRWLVEQEREQDRQDRQDEEREQDGSAERA